MLLDRLMSTSDNRYRDEIAMWHGIDKFGVVNKDYRFYFLEVMRLLDGRTDVPALYERLWNVGASCVQAPQPHHRL